MHVFIRNGLAYAAETRKELTILEVGFGTGLNALLTLMNAIENKLHVTYYAVEKYPVDIRLAGNLNYPSMLSPKQDPERMFASIQGAAWNEITAIHPCFQLCKITEDITAFQPVFTYNLVYYDAFAPEKQPEMWTPAVFDKLYSHMSDGGVLTTYCVKGDVKRMLTHAGFTVEKLPGPPGKREMLRARKG
jgi:tRNA U34 5-methylaminomethyl-2-thiouridine-forming methyltransferase MnmC